MVLAFAPIVGLLLGLSAITVPWADPNPVGGALHLIPVVAVQVIRRAVLARGDAALERLLTVLQ
jgi:ACR3 family arsenite transporter